MSTIKVERVEARDNNGLPRNLLPVTASAWVNFNGKGVITIRDSYNVSGITDNGTGDYTVNFAENFLNQNYSVCGSAGPNDGSNNSRAGIIAPTTYGVSSFRFLTARNGDNGADGILFDYEFVNLVFFGGQS